MIKVKLSNGLSAIIETEGITDTMPKGEFRNYVIQYSNEKWGTIWLNENQLDDMDYLQEKIEKYYERDLKNYNQMLRF